jgi:uncharacterized membrane protein YeaQ/YmgE (transglycosylase-associated protein family)
MSIIGWILLGLIAGFVASKIVNKAGEGVALDIVLGIGAGLFNAQYMTRMARIALMPPKAMRCRPSEML